MVNTLELIFDFSATCDRAHSGPNPWKCVAYVKQILSNCVNSCDSQSTLTVIGGNSVCINIWCWLLKVQYDVNVKSTVHKHVLMCKKEFFSFSQPYLVACAIDYLCFLYLCGSIQELKVTTNVIYYFLRWRLSCDSVSFCFLSFVIPCYSLSHEPDTLFNEYWDLTLTLFISLGHLGVCHSELSKFNCTIDIIFLIYKSCG